MKVLLLLVSLLFQQQAIRPGFGTVTGRILSADGAPTARVRVAAMALDEKGTLDSVTAVLAGLSLTDTDGRFQLQNIPPGRYLITAGLLESPSYYPGVNTPQQARAITVFAGARVDDIDFALVVPAGVSIRGRVRNVPPAAIAEGLIRVILQPLQRSPGSGFIILEAAALSPDGTFEFSRVPPGSYNLRSTVLGDIPLPVSVGEKDIEGLELTSPPMLIGRVKVDDGSPLPVPASALARGFAEPVLFLLGGIRVNTKGTGGMSHSAFPRRDGTFLFSFPTPGDYRIAATLMPLDHHIESMSYGIVDAVRSPLQIEEQPNTAELQIVLTKTPLAGTPAGVRVSGRVSGIENDPAGRPAFVSIQSQTIEFDQLTVIRAIEIPIGADGTFTIGGVPPGRYTARVVPGPEQALTFDVTNRDVSGLEIRATPSRP